MTGTNCSIDHIMIKSTTKLQMRWRMKKDKMPIRKLTTNMIKIKRVSDDLQASLNDRLTEIPAGIVEKSGTPSNQSCTKDSKRNSMLL